MMNTRHSGKSEPVQTVCIVCPNGCRLTIRTTSEKVTVSGHRCPRGEAYGTAEAIDPKRVVTCTAATDSSDWPRVPVKTDAPIAKKLIADLLQSVYSATVKLPVKRGDIVLADFRGTGVNIVSTRSMPFSRPE